MSLTVRAEGPIAVLTVDRPARRNALDLDTLDALGDAARAMQREGAVKAVVLTGSADGGGFIAGGDLQVLHAVKSARGARAFAKRAHASVDALRRLGVPLIAAVCGDAHGGGCELAAACDLRVVERQARFVWAQLNFAVTTGWGGAARLAQTVSPGTAVRWLLSADPVSADEAHAAGFADALAAPGEGLAVALAQAARFVRHDRHALRHMLTLLRETPSRGPAAARALELEHFGRSWASPAHAEAVASFLARRRG